MRFRLGLFLLPVMLVACTVGDPGSRIPLRDTSWIQPGVTTREDVIKHLGDPYSSTNFLGHETVRYGHAPHVTRAPSIPSVVATPQGYMTVTPTGPPDPSTLQERPLWIRFDNRGIVTAFGFDEPPAR
jgi:hypothetical protein